MRKLHILATAAALLVTASAPSLAASRTHRAADAYASGAVTTDRSGSYYYGPQGPAARQLSRDDAFARGDAEFRSQNLPYSDRPYGAPDNW